MAREEPGKEYMTYCGEYEMREGGSEHGSDGINGTVVAPQQKIEAAGAAPGENVRVLVEANGRSTTMERQIHMSGNTLTIPLKEREELELEPHDIIEFWIDSVDDEPNEEIQEEEVEQKTLQEESDQANPVVVIGDSRTYHLLESEDDEETACGISLRDEDYDMGEDPGDFLNPCHDCKAYSSKLMTNKEIVSWLQKEIGFESTDGPPAYFNKEQLMAVRDAFVEQKTKLRESKEEIQQLNGQLGRFKQRINELESDTV